jgi:hypothetical protein
MLSKETFLREGGASRRIYGHIGGPKGSNLTRQ